MKRKLLLMFIALFVAGSFVYGQVIDESFETWTPTGWTMDPSSGAGSWQQDDGSSHGPGTANIYDGTYAAMFNNYDYSNGTTGSMITPQFDLSSETNPTLSFYWWNNDGSSTPATIDVYTSTDNGSNWTLLETIETYGSGTTTWVQYSHILANNVNKVKLTATSDYGLKNTFVDKFVIEGISCPAPTNQTEANITSSGADLGWTSGGSNEWQIEWDTAGFTQGTGNLVVTTNNPYQLTGLSSNTQYDWYVRDICGAGDTSTWTTASTFTTTCGVYTPEYDQDFTTYLPDCWSETTGFLSNPSTLTGTSSSWMQDDFANITSNGKSAKLNIYGTSKKEWLISPSIDLSGDSYQLEFDLALTHYANTNSDTLGPDDTLAVIISTDNGTTWNLNDTLEVWTYPEIISNTGEHITIDLSSYSSTVKIGFYGSSSVSNKDNDIFVDNFKVRTPPSCPEPTDQTEANITSSGADLGWTDASGSHWDIYAVATGGTAPTQSTTPTANDVTANPYTWTGGNASTTYDWYVRSDCGQDNSNTSTWTGPSTFTTLQNPAPVQNLPFSEDWESGLNNNTWNWDAGSVSTIQTSTASKHNGTYGLEQYGNSSSSYSTPSSLSDAYTKAQSGGVNENWTTWNKMSVNLTSSSNPWLTFWYAMGYQYNDNYNNFWVQVSTDGTTWTDLYSTQTNGAAIAYNKKSFDLSSYNGTSQLYIRFFHNGKYNTNYLYLDDINVAEVSCPAPSAQTVTNIGVNQADLGWTENGSATNWEIMIDTANFDTTGYTHTAVTNNPYTKTGLGASTSYDWYVRSVCGAGDTSEWVGANSFSTSNGLATGPYPADGATKVLVSSDTLAWNPVVGATKYVLNIGTTSGGSDVLANYSITDTLYKYGSDWDYSTQYFWTVNTVYNGTNDTVTGTEWNFTTQCDATALPYYQDFDEVTAPAFPGCMTVENTNGDSEQWETSSDGLSTPNAAQISYNSNAAMDDWFFTRGLNLTGGVTYVVNFMYKAASSTYPEKLAIDWGNAAASTAMSGTPIYDNTNITNTTWAVDSAFFTPSTSGTYYVGFHGHSDADEFILYVDDIQVVQYQLNTVWNGTIDNDWRNENNWSTGIPPNTLTDVTIPAGKTNYPTLAKTAYCGNLTIQSDASGDGSLIGAEYLQAVGITTVQRYIGAWSTSHGWHAMSSPVAAQNISTEFVDVTATPISSDVDLYRWSEADNIWINIKDASGNYNQGSATTNFSNDAGPTFEVGKGYLIAYSSNQTKSFTGTLNSSDVSVSSLSYSATSGWNLLGNPYQSALFWNKTTWNLSNIDGTAKIWDDASSSYVDIAPSTGIIPAMQGFMVHVNDAAGGSLTIDASDRTHSTTTWHKDLPLNTLSFKAVETENNTAQELIIRVVDDATTGFDTQYDSRFLAGYAPQFYTVENGIHLSTDALPSLSSRYSIPLGFVKNEASHYYIEVNGLNNLDPRENVYLKDLKNNLTQLLNQNPVYEFTSSDGDDANRFELLFSPVGIGEQEAAALKPFNIYSTNNMVHVIPILDLKGKTVIQIYSIAGQLIYTTETNGNQRKDINLANRTGIFIISAVNGKEVQTQKVIIY